MAKILSQDEVDALLNGITAGEIETEPQSPPKNETEGRLLNFTCKGHFARAGLPALDIVHERFARSFRSAISATAQCSIEVNIQSAEAVKFGEFIRTVPPASSLHIFKMEPLKGLAVCILEGRMIFALIERLLGGRGHENGKPEEREFTTIEQRIIRMVVDKILENYQTAWQPVYPAQLEYVSSEINTQFINVVPSHDIIHAITMELELEETSGKLHVCFPDSLLNPIREKLAIGVQSGPSGSMPPDSTE